MERAMRALERGLGVALLAIICLNFANVVARHLFARSIVGADEVQTYVLVWIAFLGAAAVAWRGEHLRMDVLARRLPGRLRHALKRLEDALVMVLAGFTLVLSLRYALDMLRLGVRSPLAAIPMWIPHGAVALGFALVAVSALLRALGRTKA